MKDSLAKPILYNHLFQSIAFVKRSSVQYTQDFSNYFGPTIKKTKLYDRITVSSIKDFIIFP
jgi:hypothetical protein